MVLLASFSFLNLYLHEGPTRVFEAEWRGFVSSQFLRQALLEALALARQHRISAWIADDRLLGPLRPADLEWASGQVMPKLVEIGVRRFAVVPSEDPLNQLLIKNESAVVAEELPLQIRYFATLPEARAWACR